MHNSVQRCAIGVWQMAAEKQNVIPATMLRRQLGDLLKRLYTQHAHFIIEKDGLPVAALIPIAEYRAYINTKEFREREEKVKRFQESARELGTEVEKLGLTEEDVERLVEETRQQLFEEQYGHIAKP